MAIKKIVTTEEEESTTPESGKILKAVHKRPSYSADYIIERDKQQRIIIPFSPAMDYKLGGGIRSGSWVNVTGPEKTFKTSSLLHFCRNAQKPEYGGIHWPKGRKIFLFNIEGRLGARDLLGFPGLDLSPNKFEIIGHTADNFLGAEDYLETLEKVAKDFPGCVCIVDSVSMLSTKERETADIGDRFRDTAQSMMGMVTRRLGARLSELDTTVCCVLHRYENTSGQGMNKYIESGGTKAKYQADYKLIVTYTEPMDKDDHTVGQKIHWKIGTAATGYPNTEVITFFRYGYGLDGESEILDVMKDFLPAEQGGVDQKASWWYLHPIVTGEPEPLKFQGVAKAREYLVENPKVFDKIYKIFQKNIRC